MWCGSQRMLLTNKRLSSDWQCEFHENEIFILPEKRYLKPSIIVIFLYYITLWPNVCVFVKQWVTIFQDPGWVCVQHRDLASKQVLVTAVGSLHVSLRVPVWGFGVSHFSCWYFITQHGNNGDVILATPTGTCVIILTRVLWNLYSPNYIADCQPHRLRKE